MDNWSHRGATSRLPSKNKQKNLGKIAALQPDLARSIVLIKVHIKENGYALNLFFEHIRDPLHSRFAEVLQGWAGDGGQVRFLNEDEIAASDFASIEEELRIRREAKFHKRRLDAEKRKEQEAKAKAAGFYFIAASSTSSTSDSCDACSS